MFTVSATALRNINSQCSAPFFDHLKKQEDEQFQQRFQHRAKPLQDGCHIGKAAIQKDSQ